MGKYIFDKYSLLHAGAGIFSKYIGKYLGWSFTAFVIIHIIFEIAENTFLRETINKSEWWPGGKPESDSFMNSMGDTISFILGWIATSHIEQYILKKYI